MKTMKGTSFNKEKRRRGRDLRTSKPRRSTPDSLSNKKGRELMRWLTVKRDKDNSWT